MHNGVYNGHLLSFDPVKGVNLTDGAFVVFKTGFNIDNDFVLKIECYPIINKKLLQIKGDSGEIDLYLRMGSSNGSTNDSIFAELNSRSATTYTLLSECILKPNIDDLVLYTLKKKDIYLI